MWESAPHDMGLAVFVGLVGDETTLYLIRQFVSDGPPYDQPSLPGIAQRYICGHYAPYPQKLMCFAQEGNMATYALDNSWEHARRALRAAGTISRPRYSAADQETGRPTGMAMSGSRGGEQLGGCMAL